MRIDRASRLVIVGNSGSGKSTLARAIAGPFELPVHSLDPIRWDGRGVRRDAAVAKAWVADIAATETWIIEGVFGWLAEMALPRATALIWIDLPWAACRNGLLRRGRAGDATADDHRDLLAWAEGYWTRTTSSSFAGHGALYRAFQGRKRRMRSRRDVRRGMDRLLCGELRPG